MAVQLQVAYSGSFPAGAAVFAGGPYYCAKGSVVAATSKCSSTYLGTPNALDSVDTVKNWEQTGEIDPSSLLAKGKVYLFSGTLDLIVRQSVMNSLREFYSHYLSPNQIQYNHSTPAAHAWISPDAGIECSIYSVPFLNNCGIDPEENYLTQFYGALNARASTPGGEFIAFDQAEFAAGHDPGEIDLDPTGFAYVPKSCAQGNACRVHIALHGCEQSHANVGAQFIEYSGINEWADTNGIVVLYPQATPALNNPEGCWDWWGYTGADYAKKSGPQMQAIKRMLDRVTSGAR